MLVCAESDVEFWADSESSESDESTDAELSEEVSVVHCRPNN